MEPCQPTSSLMWSFKTLLYPVVLSLQQLRAPALLLLPPPVLLLCLLVLVQSYWVLLLSCSKGFLKEVVINLVFIPFR
jgi:hypothetical protein